MQDKTLISILDQSPICSSAHAAVKAVLTETILNVRHSLNQRQKKIVKLNWDRADRQSYRHSLVAELVSLNNKDTLVHHVANITGTLIRASNSSVPKKPSI